MLGFLIGIAIRRASPDAIVIPPATPFLLIEGGDHLLTESGSRLLLE